MESPSNLFLLKHVEMRSLMRWCVSLICRYILGLDSAFSQYQYQNDGKFLSDKEVPDPGLVALGVKFAPLEEFAEKYLKPRLT